MRVVVVAALLGGGCHKLLGLEPVPDARPIDAAPDAAPDAPPCSNGPLADSFDIAPPCSGLGFVDSDMTTTVTIEGGRLVIRPGPLNAMTRGGCVSGGAAMPFTAAHGAFMQVTSTDSAGEFMDFFLDWQNGTDISTIGWDSSSITYGHGSFSGRIPFDPATTSWVRMRPSDDGSVVIAEYSGDGYAWTMFAYDPTPPPASVGPSFYGGTFTAIQNPAPIYFDGFDTCPSP